MLYDTLTIMVDYRVSNLTYYLLLCSFIKAKSDISLEDVDSVVEIGLELFHKSQSKLYAQVVH